MPPKPRTTSKNATGSKKKLPPKLQDSAKTDTASGLSQEAEDQFELELCWCIQQLEMCLATGKLQEKQAHDLAKNINTLRNNSAPLIKKRQVMRNTLGNYRDKMVQEEQKHAKTASSVKFTTSSTSNKKSIFLKKAHDKQPKENENDSSDKTKCVVKKSIIDSSNTQNTFKFNFQNQE